MRTLPNFRVRNGAGFRSRFLALEEEICLILKLPDRVLGLNHCIKHSSLLDLSPIAPINRTRYSDLTMNSDQTVIAVVDDEESICKGLERLLRSAGLTAKTFLNGADFLSFLENGRPDCLVLDLNMMPMNGFSILDRLARLGWNMPVIIITGDDSEETYECAMNHQGIAAFLRKPVDGQLLLDAIDEAVGRRA
jgi:CheY-like chemotaxis protein